MKKLFVLAVVLMFGVTTSYAADFAPTLLKLSADPIVQYSFDGSELSIPVQVSGTPAGIIFSVFTKDQSANIPDTINGFLGWHHVNKVDTCLYYSTLKSVNAGANTIKWDGKDQDGGVIPAGEYTYYLWAFDNQGAKQRMTDFLMMTYRIFNFQELDESGLPMSNPIFYSKTQKWTVGNDPMDSTLLEGCTLTLATDWASGDNACLEKTDFSSFYVGVKNKTAGSAGIQKFNWVPGGVAEVVSDWGDGGYSELFSTLTDSHMPVVVSDNNYLFTVDMNYHEVIEANGELYIYDLDGSIVDLVDLTGWWCSLADLDAGAQMCGGPDSHDIRNSMVFLNCHCSCINQMVDPYRYLDSGDSEDLFVWTNRNGDYVLDHNFEDTAALPWVCMDYNVGPYKYNISADDNLFSLVTAYDVGSVSFGLYAPDGSGIGYLSYAGETAGYKRASLYIDSGTPFDGLYCDNMQTGGTHYEWVEEDADYGMFFVGHDSISGVITSGVGVEEAAPAAFAVDQNAPNPFNPTTTISFSLADAGNVSIEVYNVAGQKIDTIADGFMNAGSHSVVWDASDFSAGVYFYTVKSGGISRTMKMTLLK